MSQRQSMAATAHLEKEPRRLVGLVSTRLHKTAEISLVARRGECRQHARQTFTGSRSVRAYWRPVAVMLVLVVALGSPMVAQGDSPTIDLPDPLTLRMAQVAKGESGIDPADPACVMRNRIVAGWNPDRLLGHFYAPARPVTDEELERVREVLATGAGCDPRAYFQWSTSDVARIQPSPGSWLFSANGNHYYDRDALKG